MSGAAFEVPPEVLSHLGLVVAVTGLAVLVRSTLGFGDALVAMPLLLLCGVEHREAVALVAANSVVTATAILVMDRGREERAEGTWALVVAAVPGLALGLWFLEAASGSLVVVVLGVTVVAVGLLGVACDPRRWRVGPRAAWGFGFASGLLGGAFNVHGPPLAIFGTARGWRPEIFRATCQLYFFATGLILVTAHSVAGRLGTGEGITVAACLPAIAMAGAVGGWLNRRLPVEAFRRLVYLVLVIVGGLLVARGFQGTP